jgi:hypothetical protein
MSIFLTLLAVQAALVGIGVFIVHDLKDKQ